MSISVKLTRVSSSAKSGFYFLGVLVSTSQLDHLTGNGELSEVTNLYIAHRQLVRYSIPRPDSWGVFSKVCMVCGQNVENGIDAYIITLVIESGRVNSRTPFTSIPVCSRIDFQGSSHTIHPIYDNKTLTVRAKILPNSSTA